MATLCYCCLLDKLLLMILFFPAMYHMSQKSNLLVLLSLFLRSITKKIDICWYFTISSKQLFHRSCIITLTIQEDKASSTLFIFTRFLTLSLPFALLYKFWMRLHSPLKYFISLFLSRCKLLFVKPCNLKLLSYPPHVYSMFSLTSWSSFCRFHIFPEKPV